MTENLFKTKSLVEIEDCLGKALTDLIGRKSSVSIAGIDTPQGFLVAPVATFTVTATHDRDFEEGDPW